jgi:hypothetical protein
MVTRRTTVIAWITGAIIGALAWPVIDWLLADLPLPLCFGIAWFLFTFGPGVAVAGWLTRDLDALRRVVIVLGVGSATTAVLIDVLGRLASIAAFPYVSLAMAGGGIAAWRMGQSSSFSLAGTGQASKLLAACGVLVALTSGMGVLVFAHRLQETPSGIVLYGDYDSADLGYYAAEASEASHTIPPTASYYSGHKLNAAYYPHLVLGMIHRFTGVPVMKMYYRYAWPAFQTLSALTAFALISSLVAPGVALLAVFLILIGSDFSYLAAWLLPHATVQWDYVLWPTNFLSPTMEVQHFATWGPSLPVFFTILFAIVRGLQTRRFGWFVLAGLLIGILFQFKPFIYIVLMAALSASTVLSYGDRFSRSRFAAVIATAIIATLPSVYGITQLDPTDRRSKLIVDVLLLPERMLIKLNLTEVFAGAASRLAPTPAFETAIFLLLASVLFFPVGVGLRWLGAPGVWRAIRPNVDSDAAAWRLLGWIVVAGILIPCVIATEPYVDTLQFYLTGLYIMWIFTAVALARFAKAHPRVGVAAVALAVAMALPSSLHYLARKWTDDSRQVRASLTAGEVAIAQYLRDQDPETTVILHDRPLSPSLMTIVAARRIVLGWDVRYSAVGGEDRLRDVNRFFASASGDPFAALDVLRRYEVTHVLVREPGDRVHPDVLAQLRLLMEFPDVKLYQVPWSAHKKTGT